MRPGGMLEVLHRVEDDLPDLLREGVDSWHSLDIDYEPPLVERLWRSHQWRGHQPIRIYLHRIHPCKEALYHPHPWASAVRVISGRYEMGIGHTLNVNIPPTEVARVVLGPGDQYEMLDPAGWHYVKPIDVPSLSVMVTFPFTGPQIFSHAKFGKAADLGPLDEASKAGLHEEFTEQYHYWRANR